jgi:hypothetical protein
VPTPFQLGFTALLNPEERARQLLRDDHEKKLQIPLSPEEHKVLRALLFHIGHRSALPRRDLERKSGLGERDVKEVIRNLIVTHEIAIGARRGKIHGYFLVATAEDLDVASGPLVSELREIARRLRVLHGKEKVSKMFGQMALEESA